MTTVAAEAILAIPTSTPAAANTPDAPDVPGGAGPRLDATRQLQALVADGWSLTRLADAAGIDERTAWRTVHGYAAPSPRTTAAVDALYEQLRLDDPGDGAAAVRSRRPLPPARRAAGLDVDHRLTGPRGRGARRRGGR